MTARWLKFHRIFPPLPGKPAAQNEMEVVMHPVDRARINALRLFFPARLPRWQTLLWSPLAVVNVAVDAYHSAFFACLPDRNRS